jgi:protein transport protein DSL1/ZW10
VKSKYYTAVGTVVEAVLDRILEEILALPDITEVESHRLSELCRIFNSLEGLFLDDPEQVSLMCLSLGTII